MMSTPQIQTIMQKARLDMHSFAAGTLDMTDVDMIAGIGSVGCFARTMLPWFFEIIFMLTIGRWKGFQLSAPRRHKKHLEEFRLYCTCRAEAIMLATLFATWTEL